MSILAIAALIAAFCLIYWLIIRFVPVPFRTMAIVIFVIIVILILLGIAGVGNIGHLRVG